MNTGNPRAIWQQRSRRLLRVFAPILIITGIAGFLVPSRMALMSGACPYNVFHLIAGSVGLALAFSNSAQAATAFNVGFGVVDLYQAVAGVVGFFPAGVFALRPADHVVHAALGLLLVVVGWHGRPVAPARRNR
ncbi:MAG TPA: DUF4383 domain-containing protein [Polyangia bacterium]|jgi:hypothetical protein|nr:DUF4383 domain-containing protein [Polyangia bacterium]